MKYFHRVVITPSLFDPPGTCFLWFVPVELLMDGTILGICMGSAFVQVPETQAEMQKAEGQIEKTRQEQPAAMRTAVRHPTHPETHQQQEGTNAMVVDAEICHLFFSWLDIWPKQDPITNSHQEWDGLSHGKAEHRRLWDACGWSLSLGVGWNAFPLGELTQRLQQTILMGQEEVVDDAWRKETPGEFSLNNLMQTDVSQLFKWLVNRSPLGNCGTMSPSKKVRGKERTITLQSGTVEWKECARRAFHMEPPVGPSSSHRQE